MRNFRYFVREANGNRSTRTEPTRPSAHQKRSSPTLRLEHHAPFSGYSITESAMPLCINFFIIESGIAMCRKKKFVCVYLLQVGQALAMRCRCRAPDFDITGRNTKSDICLLKKFSLCAVYMRKDMRLSRSSNYVYILYIYIYITNMCVYIYTHVSRVSLCIHALE